MAKTILITGASTGIGAATARRLAKDNTLILHYHRSKEPAEQVVADVEAAGGTAHLFQTDLASEEGCRALAAFAGEKTDKLDVLVNNAGGLVRRAAADALPWQLMYDIFALNTLSTMMMSSLCIPLLKKGENPTIINVTSIAIRHGAPSATIYGASKGALDVFTRGLAKELAPGIRVNAVAPGVIETPFHAHVTTSEKMEEFKSMTPVGRNGQPDDIAHAIEFLIENRFTTGETLDINGGLFMQ